MIAHILLWLCFLAILLFFLYCTRILHRTPYEYFYPRETLGIQYVEKPMSRSESYDWSQISLLILIPVYNSDIWRLRRRILHLTHGCREWNLYLYGLDSTLSTTLEQLNTWAAEDADHVSLVQPTAFSRPLSRTVRIANIRNALLDAARKDSIVSKPRSSDKSAWTAPCDCAVSNTDAIVLVMDGDLVGPMSKRGLLEACLYLRRNNQVYAVASSGGVAVVPGYHSLYDSFAYRNLDNQMICDPTTHSRRILNLDEYWTEMLPYVYPVRSAFNGACVYRWNELRQVSYPLVPGVCEHVSLHEELRLKFPRHTNMVVLSSFHLYPGYAQDHVK